MKIFLRVLSLFLLICVVEAREIPRGGRPVTDEAGLLSRRLNQQLTRALLQVKKQTGHEIALLTVSSLEGSPIEDFSIRVVDQWKLGDREKDNGVLFLIAVNERKMRIEVGQGLEGVLPDALAGRIIRNVQPYFKKGDYRSGIILGLSQIIKQTGGTLTDAPRVKNRRSSKKFSSLIFFIFLILAMFTGGGGRGFLLGMLLGGMRGSGGGGSFGSGGGGFGGGGGFSGGGASGDW